MDLTKFAQILKTKRLDNSLSSSQAAAKLDVSIAYYSRLESGKEQPTIQLIEKIAERLRLHPEDHQTMLALAGRATSAVTESAPASNVKIDPAKMPVLFSDILFVTVSENGVVMDFGQKIGPTNDHQVVSRIGVSLRHAEKIHKLLGDQIRKARSMGVEN